MLDARRRLVVLAALVGGLAVSSCAREKPAPPVDEGTAPATTLRPLTSRDHAAPPVPEGAPASSASLPPGHPPLDSGAMSAGPATGAEGPSVAGTITVAPALKAKATGSVLFVIARTGADRHIVAVRREDNVSFPLAFRISGADAMTAGTTFAGPLEITARLSKSGDAVAARGDVEGVAKGVAVPAKDVKVVLDSVRE